MIAQMKEIIKQAGAATSLGNALKGATVKTDLDASMHAHGKLLYGIYNEMQELLKADCEDMKKYEPHLLKVKAADEWYQKHRKSANDLLRPVTAIAKAKPAAKKKVAKTT